eukprot:scaffold4256_cov152-Skeletonema_menzelii.AAC.3
MDRGRVGNDWVLILCIGCQIVSGRRSLHTLNVIDLSKNQEPEVAANSSCGPVVDNSKNSDVSRKSHFEKEAKEKGSLIARIQ